MPHDPYLQRSGASKEAPHIGEDAHKQWWTPWFLMVLTAATLGTFLFLTLSEVVRF